MSETGPIEPIELLVCTTCRSVASPDRDGAADDPAVSRAGAVLVDRLQASELPEHVHVIAVACLSNCSRGCTVVLRGGVSRWTYVYGDIDPDEQVDVVLDGVRRYRDAPQGLVPWRERSVHFRKHCIARVPPPEPLA